MSKKLLLFSVVVILLLVGTTVAACAPKPAPTPAPKPTPAPAPAQPPKAIKWTCQMAFPAGDPWYVDEMDILQKRILPATGGRLIIDIFPGGAICPAGEEAKALRAGTLDYAYTANGYNKDLDPGLPLFDQMSGGLTSTQLFYFMELYGDDMLTPVYDKFDLVWISQMIGTPEDFCYTKGLELKTLADVKKLKMRTAGIGGEIIQKMGGSTVFLPGGELYESMQRGVINAFEYSGAASCWEMKFQEVIDYLYVSSARAPSDANCFLASKKAWSALPEDLKATVLWIQRGSEQLSWTRALKANGEALEKIKAYGVKVQPLPKEIDDAVRATATAYFDAEVAKYGPGSLYAKTVKAMRDFKKVCDAQGVQ